MEELKKPKYYEITFNVKTDKTIIDIMVLVSELMKNARSELDINQITSQINRVTSDQNILIENQYDINTFEQLEIIVSNNEYLHSINPELFKNFIEKLSTFYISQILTFNEHITYSTLEIISEAIITGKVIGDNLSLLVHKLCKHEKVNNDIIMKLFHSNRVAVIIPTIIYIDDLDILKERLTQDIQKTVKNAINDRLNRLNS